jgi:putative transposase
LHRRLKAGDARAAALVACRRGPKQDSKRLDDGVEGIIGTTLRRYYLVCERSRFLRPVREIRAECEAKGFRAPTRKTIKARLDVMDQREVLRKRKGAKEADKVFAARSGRLEVARPLEIVQIDHTPEDIILTGGPLVDHF